MKKILSTSPKIGHETTAVLALFHTQTQTTPLALTAKWIAQDPSEIANFLRSLRSAEERRDIPQLQDIIFAAQQGQAQTIQTLLSTATQGSDPRPIQLILHYWTKHLADLKLTLSDLTRGSVIHKLAQAYLDGPRRPNSPKKTGHQQEVTTTSSSSRAGQFDLNCWFI